MFSLINSTEQKYPIDIIDVKDHLRIDFSYDDSYLQSLIAASVQLAEAQTNRIILPSTATVLLDEVRPTEQVFLPYGNCLDIVVKSNETTLSAGNDYIVGKDFILFIKQQTELCITFKCGFTEESCPPAIKQALLMLVGTMYESRMDVTVGVHSYKSKFASENLLAPFKLY